MARGGYRPGSGRPKGSFKGKGPVFPAALSVGLAVAGVAPAAAVPALLFAAGEQTPLAYALAVMRDEDADEARRDRMAQVAMPFVHAKAGEVAGKKGELAQAAQTAGKGKFAPAAAPRLVINNTK